jgi:hypothetical protein
MDEACRMANKNIYIVQSINSLDDKTKEAYASEKEISLTDISDIALNEAYIKKCFFSDFTTEIINNSSIKNGVDGVNLYNANAFFSSDDIDLNISYTIPIPFLPWNPIEVSINQRLLFRCFTGEDITDKTGSSTKYVYVTAGGDVYHTSPYCSYLSKYYDILSDALFEEALSETDSYTACMYCGDTPNPHGCVFMCPHSKVYHCDINCFNLDTKVYSVPFEDVCDHMPLCSRCKLGVD